MLESGLLLEEGREVTSGIFSLRVYCLSFLDGENSSLLISFKIGDKKKKKTTFFSAHITSIRLQHCPTNACVAMGQRAVTW